MSAPPALILAAGYGSRLAARSPSKPLTSIGGRPLIEHVARAAVAGGADRLVVVTGHRAQEVEAFLAGLAPRLGVAVDPVRLERWDRPNGHSVVAGTEAIDGDFLLMMSDHLFDPAIARRLIAGGSAGPGVTLAVDRDCARPGLDLDDATKVATRGDAIVQIGKSLERYDAVDTGLFVATPALAHAIAAEIAAGAAGSLSEGVQRLADEGGARALDVTGLFWLDVDDAAGLEQAERRFAPGAI